MRLEIARGRNGRVSEAADLEIPEAGRDEWLVERIEVLKAEMKTLRDEAFVRGGDPRQRALEAGRLWKEGDGY